MFYEIMHRESCVAQLSTTGECRVCLEDFMPYDLVLVESDDFDERIVNYLVEQFKISDGINLSKDVSAMQRLREEAEKAKKELSSSVTTNINLPFIAMSKDGPHHIDITLSRQTFNELTADLVDRTITPVENALHDAGLSKTDINMVLLVGGSTRIPAVADKVRQLMGKEPSRNLNPDECVALGAAVQDRKSTRLNSSHP